MNCISKKNIVLFLIIIATISLGFKLYTVDFTVIPNEDTFEWVLIALAHNNGDFTEHPRKTLGWTIFVSPFFHLIDSNNFLDYVNITRALGLAISIITIIPMYLLSRKFFDDKYSLCATALFAFEPHLNQLSWQGLTEQLYILVIILSMYFILNRNSNYSYLSFLAIGLLWWVRWQGIIMLLVVSILFFRNFKKTPKLFVKYSICLSISLIVVSPMLLDRYEQFGDPFYSEYSERIFAGSYEKIAGENTARLNPTMMDYIENEGLGSLLENYILKGFFNTLMVLSKISLPYLFILIPFGILFSFRAFDQDRNYIRANWIFILLSIASMLIVIAVIPERRFLYFLLPFLIIFSVIPIQRVVEYGLSTFSFTKKQKNIFLIIVIFIVIILSGCFTVFGFGKPDVSFENEKKDFAKFVINNIDGKVLREFGPATDYVSYQIITNTPEQFKQYKIGSEWAEYQELDKNEKGIESISIYGKSLAELVKNGKEFELEYIIAKKEKNFYPFLSDLYSNEENYPYMVKIFDSNEFAYKKLKVKVFEIDYEKFNKNNE